MISKASNQYHTHPNPIGPDLSPWLQLSAFEMPPRNSAICQNKIIRENSNTHMATYITIDTYLTQESIHMHKGNYINATCKDYPHQ